MIFKVGTVAQQPGQHNVGLVVFGFTWLQIRRVGGFNVQWCSIAFFIRHRDGAIQCLEPLQRPFFKCLLLFMGRNIPEGHEHRITGVVVGLVEGFQLLIG